MFLRYFNQYNNPSCFEGSSFFIYPVPQDEHGDSSMESLNTSVAITPVDVLQDIANKDAEYIELQMRQTLQDIEDVDAKLQDLNERKSSLIRTYDRLKEAKMQIHSKKLANENWHEGTYQCTDKSSILFI